MTDERRNGVTDESRAVAVRSLTEVRRLNYEETGVIWASAGADVKSPEVRKALALIGERYELDPALGEVMILGGKVYITVEGYLRIADQQPMYDGYKMWPMSDDERKAYRVADDEFAYIAEVYRKDRRFPGVGYGVASDATVSMAPMRLHKREVAEGRALRRALKVAFRASIPNYDDALESIEQYQPVAVQIAAAPDVAPPPPSPDWSKFWVHAKGIGAEHDEVHRALGVQSMKDWPGSIDQAVAALEKYVLQRDQTPAEPPPQPKPVPETTAKPQTREQINADYDREYDRSLVLGTHAKQRQLTWADSYIAQELQGVRNRNRAAEEAGAAK
jgi:hypothetical protein